MLGSDDYHHTVKGSIEGIPDIVKKHGKDETFKVIHQASLQTLPYQ